MPPQALTLNKMDKDKATALTAEEAKRLISGRITNEYNKHSQLEWPLIAASKIYSEWSECYAQQLKEKEAEIELVNSELSDLRRRTYHYHLDVHENKLRKLESQLSAATKENEVLKALINKMQEKYDENGYSYPSEIKIQRLEQHLDMAFSIYQKDNERLMEALKEIKDIDDIDDEAWMIAHAALTPNNEQNNLK